MGGKEQIQQAAPKCTQEQHIANTAHLLPGIHLFHTVKRLQDKIIISGYEVILTVSFGGLTEHGNNKRQLGAVSSGDQPSSRLDEARFPAFD